MATFNAFVPTDPDRPLGGRRAPPRFGAVLDPGGITTIFYITSGGAFGSTTDPSSVPAGAGIVRRVTS